MNTNLIPLVLRQKRYKSYADASAAGLVSVDSTTSAVTLSVDTTNTYKSDGSQGGRPSVRIESKDTVDHGLVIGDFAHMPGSVCGSWPACEYLSLQQFATGHGFLHSGPNRDKLLW